MHQVTSALGVLLGCGVVNAAGPAALTSGYYRVLPAEPHADAPFAAVEFTYGPEPTGGGVAWQLTIRAEDNASAAPLMELRAVTTADPLADDRCAPEFRRYQLRVPPTQETLEFVNIHTQRPLLPAWGDFGRYFVPFAARGTRRQAGLPNTCEFLGHVLTLQRTATNQPWPQWEDCQTLSLDPELLIGTGRSSKDQEGRRLPQQPQRQNYTYIPFTAEDYKTMIEAGINLYTVAPNQEEFVRSQPVFYLRSAAGKPPLRYPADLYRSNYVGATMFMDEPTCIMIGDKQVHNLLRYFTDATALLTKRVRARYMDEGSYGALQLSRQLRQRGVSLGDMVLAQVDYPAWETIYETAWYQLAGGLPGIVHEGRYQLDEFNQFVKASTGIERQYKPEEMLLYVYAYLRGAARHFNGDWGTSIYGQADPKLSPLAMRLAYDMGARYLWYWTSDHDHHLPYNEQLELTRGLRAHAKAHPRPSIRGSKPIIDKLILIPYGYFITLESATARAHSGDLWWVRELDPQKSNESSQRYRRLVTHVITEVNRTLDAGQSFDIAVDDGTKPQAYREVVRISEP